MPPAADDKEYGLDSADEAELIAIAESSQREEDFGIDSADEADLPEMVESSQSKKRKCSSKS